MVKHSGLARLFGGQRGDAVSFMGVSANFSGICFRPNFAPFTLINYQLLEYAGFLCEVKVRENVEVRHCHAN